MAGNELKAVITMDAANATFTVEKFVGQTVGGMGQAATAAKSTESAFGGLGGAAVMLNQGLQLVQQAGHLASAAFDLLVGGAQRTGEQYLLLSQQTGLTVEEISAMSVAAATAGVSNEALALTTKKLSVNMVDAAGGGKESTATFKALGVEIKNADGTLRNVNDVFLDTIDALGQIENEAERTAASQAAFGRSSQELAALIADGSGKIREQAELAAKLGLVWSGPAAQAADELGDQTTILGAALKGISDEIGARSIPSMTRLVSATNDWIVKNREAISQNIEAVFRGVGAAADYVASRIDAASQVVSGLGDAIAHVLPSADALSAVMKFIGALPMPGLKMAAADLLSFSASNAQAANTAVALAASLDGMVRSLQASGPPSDEARAQMETMARELSDLTRKYPAAARAVDAYRQRVDEAGKATGDADNPNRSFADGMKKTGDEALKSAQSVAQLAGQSVQFAQAQLQQAAATGSLTATTDAYVVAVGKAGEAYQVSQKAADEAAAAGKSATEVAAMRTQAEQQLATAVNQAATTQATAYAREEAAQSSLAHSLGQSKIAHDMEALAMADATQVAEAYSQTVVDIAAELARTTDEINKKRGVTLTAAEADKLLAEANERAGQQISAAGKAAVQASSQVSEFGRAVQSASDQAADAFGDLAARIITGSVSFKDAGKAAAQIFMRAFEDVLSSTLSSVFKSAFNSLLGLGGGGGGLLSGLFSGLGSAFATELPNAIAPSIAAAGSNQAILQGALQFGGSTASSMAGSLGSALATAGPLAAVAVGAGIFVDGITNIVSGDMEKGLMEAAIAVPVVGVPAIIVEKLLDAFGVIGPDMRKRIAVFVEKQLTQALSQDTDYVSALETGFTPLGIAITPALVQTLAGASRQNDALRAQAAILADQYGADFMAGFSPAFTASINKHGASSTSVPVSDWIRAFFPDADAASQAYAQELAKSLASVEVASMGLTGADAITYTEQLAAGYVDLAQKQGLSIDQFVAMLEVQNQAAGMSTQFLASLDQLNAGLSTQKGALDEVAAGMSAAFGVPVSGSNLVDMFIQVAGATGDAGKAAEVFTNKIQAMAAEDPALRALVDSMDPPLVDALHAVEDGGNAAAKAIGKLTGQANTSLAGAEARILAFGDALFTVAEDGSKQLSTLGEELNSELVSGISGIEDAIKEEVNSAAGLTSDTLGEAFAELKSLAALPAEALDDSTTAAIDHLKAVIQAATGWSAEQIDTMIATAADVPPPVQPVPPETTASLDDAADSTGQIADNSQAAADASEQLTTATQGTAEAVAATTQGFADMASQTLSALQSVIGVADDGKSVQALSFQLDSITQFLPAEMVPAFQESFDSSNASVSSTFTKVGELQSALNALASGNYDIHQTITTEYVTVGEPPPDTADDTGHAAGHWTVPGPQGAPYRTTVHGGEEVLSVEQSRDYRRTMRERALDGLEARAGSTVLVPVPEARAPAPGDVAGEVVDRLTQGGRLHLFVVPEVDAQKLADAMVLTGIDRASRSGALMGVQLRRNPARPS